MKLTEWFGPEVKPSITGVYRTDAIQSTTIYQNWNGDWWGAYAPTVERADFDSNCKSVCQGVKWRGLAEKP